MFRLRRPLQYLAWPVSSSKSSRSLYTAEQMHRIIDRERLRCDRSNSVFSLLTLTFPTPCESVELRSISTLFHNRLRAIDEAGLLESDRIGIVLPETPSAGAWNLANDLLHLLPVEARCPVFEVFSYPTGVDWENDSPREQSATISTGNAKRSGEDAEQVRDTRQVTSMNAFFMQSLPAWKRAIDVAGAFTALVLAAPVMLVCAVIIKLTSSGPILFVQLRDGHCGRKFWIYKFRTMVSNADAMKAELRCLSEQDGPAFKLKNDPRVTRFGRFLRRSCLDEVPQLFNILKGDMTLVGPRPMCSKESRHCSQWQARRLDVTPGLTCTWQLLGCNKVTFSDWMRMDLRYASSQSLLKDLRLIVMTIPSIIRRDGVY